MKKIICLFSFLTIYHIEVKAQTATTLSFLDTRAVATAPTTYSRNLVGNFKQGDVLGLPGNSNYYSVVGLRGWSDDSGGPAHELAFSNDNGIFIRSGYNSGWGAWNRLVTTSDINGNIEVNNSQKMGINLSTQTFNYQNIIQPHYGFQWLTDSWNTGAPTFWLSSFSGIKLFTAGQMRFAINSDGNVGIGTTTPGAKLDINGTTYSRKVFIGTPDASTIANIGGNLLAVNGTAVFVKAKVALYGSEWPDYVFSPAYSIYPLDSLERFINLNGHLPEIPTASDVEKNGIDLGDNQVLLLKKIEELTLIVIEQNKRIEKLEKERLVKSKNH